MESQQICDMLMDLSRLVAAHGEFLAKFGQHTQTEEAPDSLDERSPLHPPWHTRPPDQQPFAAPPQCWPFPPSITQAPPGIKPWAVPRLRLEPPRFDGENAPDWIRHIQKYYNHNYTPLDDRLYLTKYLFDHPASDWMTDWTDNNDGKGWDDFLFAVKQRFDPEPYADYAGPVRKPHNSSSDLLAWSEAPSPAVSSTANAVRANQPVDGVYKVLLDDKITEENAGQITEETAGILNIGKPCSGYKPKAMNDGGDGSTGSGAYDDIVKCRTSVCIVQRAPLTAADSSNPRLLEKEKFACFDDTSDAGPKPLFSDGRKSCLEPNTLLGVGNQNVFRQEQILASDARSIPPRKDVTRSGESLSSSLRQSDPSTMLELEKGMLDIEELGERIVTSSIRPSHLNLEVGNSLLDLMNSEMMEAFFSGNAEWSRASLQFDANNGVYIFVPGAFELDDSYNPVASYFLVTICHCLIKGFTRWDIAAVNVGIDRWTIGTVDQRNHLAHFGDIKVLSPQDLTVICNPHVGVCRATLQFGAAEGIHIFDPGAGAFELFDSRAGENSSRLQRCPKFQVILILDSRISPTLFIPSLSISIHPAVIEHDIYFVTFNWSRPEILGWDIWLNIMVVLYSINCQLAQHLQLIPISVAITYGLDPFIILLPRFDHFKGIQDVEGLPYKASFMETVRMLLRIFDPGSFEGDDRQAGTNSESLHHGNFLPVFSAEKEVCIFDPGGIGTDDRIRVAGS